jgi:two pore calcium channel protein 3
MPAFNESMLYVIFFLAYLLVNLYLFMNLLLAVIFSNYKQHLQAKKSFLFLIKNVFIHLGRKTINS